MLTDDLKSVATYSQLYLYVNQVEMQCSPLWTCASFAIMTQIFAQGVT